MLPKIAIVGLSGATQHVSIDSETYRAIVRLRYRRYLYRRGLPYEAVREIRSLRLLRAVAIAVATKRLQPGSP